ncbi:SAM-dependent methyltransferase [Streptomyces sp. ISL-66]|uniref:SAM-dependent methyltransferase n=1 Tax=Streptomyces sp. ISL-66 TaxID=2819186 RepID=UPI001BE67ED3|nr:SAM-dependent methyltransferase [Streptomyces sp. ISL-66]MBT2469546.1 SAM-dependent methyltransferase [Streptomyces sp. ISL-66]
MIDLTRPSYARMYDYLIGGTDNYPADRDACEGLLRIAPTMAQLAQSNRAFLVRAVRYLARERGVRRFLDFGTGLPSRPNVHEVAQAIDPAASVVYIDNDPMVCAHGRMVLEENLLTTAVVEADIRQLDTIFSVPRVRRLLAANEPVAALFVSVLHCIDDDADPWSLVREVAARLPSGSFIVISHLASDDPTLREDLTAFMQRTITGWGRVRSTADIGRFFQEMNLQEHPQPVEVSTWNPDTDLLLHPYSRDWIEYGGVAQTR